MLRITRTLVRSAALAIALALFAPAVAFGQSEPSGGVSVPVTSESTLPMAATSRLDAALFKSWGGLPGGATAIVIVPGRGRWVGAVGYADDERKRPMTPAMQSLIGSVTKTYTAMLVLQEVATGRLSLDDRLSRWYPEIPKAEEITLAMLLNMSTGIADYLNEDVVTVAKELMVDPGRRYLPDALIAQGAAMPRTFDVPGTEFSYSNTNTVILGRILEKETGLSLETLLQDRLFGPLRMNRSFLDTSGRLRAPHAQTYSDVYVINGSGTKVGLTTDWSQSIVWAAGGLASTIGDLGRWGRTLGTGRGAIPPALAAQRLDNCSPATNPTPDVSMAYCLGLVVARDTASGQLRTLWHNGRVFGAVAYVGYYPATGAVVAVIANSDMTDADGQPVSMRAKAAIEAAVPRLLGF
jgi:D-alanyl-D-alanine carboxypeptidase